MTSIVFWVLWCPINGGAVPYSPSLSLSFSLSPFFLPLSLLSFSPLEVCGMKNKWVRAPGSGFTSWHWSKSGEDKGAGWEDTQVTIGKNHTRTWVRAEPSLPTCRRYILQVVK